MEKDAKATLHYEGKIYHFWSVACNQAFDANPKKYIKKGG